MSRVSGWCSQHGNADHAGCRVPGDCSCGCPEDAAKVAKQRQIEQEFAALAWDNGGPSKDGPAGALTPVAPGLTDDRTAG